MASSTDTSNSAEVAEMKATSSSVDFGRPKGSEVDEDIDGDGAIEMTIKSSNDELDAPALNTPRKPKRKWYLSFGRGLYKDFNKRKGYYISDWTDSADWKVLASIIFMFFTSIGPAVTFGKYLSDNTKYDVIVNGTVVSRSDLGVPEVLMATGLAGVIFSIFSGQGMVIVGVTGPVSIFTKTVFSISNSIGVNFIPFLAWICIWTAIMHWILAITNASYLIKLVTRFSCEVFGFLIAIIYIANAIQEIIGYFNNNTLEAALLSFTIAMAFFLTCMQLAAMPLTVYFRHWIRQIIADYAAAICMVFYTGFTYIGILGDIDTPRVDVPDTFSTTNNRGWFVNLGDIQVWAIFAAIIPAVILTILFFFDHNVSSLLSQKPEFNLKKPSAFHLDFFVLGITILVCGLLGIPPTNGLIPQAPLHTQSLATIENYVENGKTKERYVKVVEQRMSNLMQAVLIGVCLAPPLLKVIGIIPNAVLTGLFLYMGFASFNGNQFFERMMLLFTDKNHIHGPPSFIDLLSMKTIAKFTIIQFVCWAVIYGVTWTPAEMIFPLFIALLVPLRKWGFPRIFSKYELSLLDSDGEIDDPGLNEKEVEEDDEDTLTALRSNVGGDEENINEPPSVKAGDDDEQMVDDEQVHDNVSINSQHIMPPVLERERLLRENEKLWLENENLRVKMGLEPLRQRQVHKTDHRARIDDLQYEGLRQQHYQAKKTSFAWRL